MDIIFKSFGIIGLILITIGVLLKKRKTEDKFYIMGGICLVVYSTYIKDMIFITLQIIFILVAIYDYRKKRR